MDLEYLGRQRVMRIYSSAFVWDMRVQASTFLFCLVISNSGSCNYYIDQPIWGHRTSYKQKVCTLPRNKV